MSARWFRFYADAMRHPKVAKLPDATFRLWVQLMCVAAENDGRIPCAEDLKFMLNRRLDHLLRGLDDLIRASLIDVLDDGYEPHSWSERQYKSDTSTDRVRKHREKRNVSVTPPDTDTEIEPTVLANSRSRNEQGGIGEDIPAKPKVSSSVIDEALEKWASAASHRGWPIPRKLTDQRKRKLAARLKTHGLDGWREALVKAYRSPLLSASPPPTWFTLDWITKNDENLLKVLEGNYDRGFGEQGAAAPVAIDRHRTPEELAAARQRLIERGEISA